MASAARHGTGPVSCHRLCHEKFVLGHTPGCQSVPGGKHKKARSDAGLGVSGAGSCRPLPDAESFPLDGGGRFA